MDTTYPTITTARGRTVAYDPAVAAAVCTDALPLLRSERGAMAALWNEHVKVANRYANGPATVAVEHYRHRPTTTKAAVDALREAVAAAERGDLHAAYVAASAAGSAYSGGQSQIGNPEWLGRAAEQLRLGWRAAVQAVQA